MTDSDEKTHQDCPPVDYPPGTEIQLRATFVVNGRFFCETRKKVIHVMSVKGSNSPSFEHQMFVEAEFLNQGGEK